MKIEIILNGKAVEASPGETILSICRREGINIPTLCHDPRIEPYSSCYVCVVEIAGIKNLQPSCSTLATQGMNITTDSPRIHKSRKTALELLLSNHYADCIGPCKQTCPAGVDVQGYISLIEKGLFAEALALIKEDNPLPAICGRVCVRNCEIACRRNLLGESGVGVDYLKRFVADQDLLSDSPYKPQIPGETGKRIAIIGAGPGGLSAAWFLRRKGHSVDIFEAKPYAGGMLRYGIPEYRLPNDILQREIDNITALGVRIFYNQKLGESLTVSSLKSNYQAAILTVGSQKGTRLGCEGDQTEGVYTGIDFLRNMEITGQKYKLNGKTVAVVGGGNTAMDCCRTAMRCGADKVYVVYRRTEDEMPANPIEIHESKIEGIEYIFLAAPLRVNADENGRVKSMSCQQMELGQPDASGRRKPVPVEGAVFDLPVDLILSAIGQQTEVDFLDQINSLSDSGQLSLNRWGNIDTNPQTLQTGIPWLFAAGDSVTGPATLIEAIAQAKIAAQSCDLYINGEEVTPARKEFLSLKSNLDPAPAHALTQEYKPAKRHEMPVLNAADRKNFSEVELGYAGRKTAISEAERCLECGCVAYYDCDLKKHAGEYEAVQQNFKGAFTRYLTDYSHPYIEIDNNKCILCARCVRICHEVAGADALGLVNRGFETYVAPAMANSLTQTTCIVCGLCISTCPTGAITENTRHKPGPLKLDSFTMPNPCNSTGETLRLHHYNGFIMKAEGEQSPSNPQGNIGRQARFGYNWYNDTTRILRPLRRTNDQYEEISFETAFELIHNQIANTTSHAMAFFAGARLTNEEQYLIQKLARQAAKTTNIGSFHYLGREAHRLNGLNNVDYEQLKNCKLIWIVGSQTNTDDQYISYLIQQARIRNKAKVVLFSTGNEQIMQQIADQTIEVKSVYWLFKTLNLIALSRGLENRFFLNDHSPNIDIFRNKMQAQNLVSLVEKAGISVEVLNELVAEYNRETNAVVIFSEKGVSAASAIEIRNLSLLTGKSGKTASGIVALKEAANAQGLFDTGCALSYGIEKAISEKRAGRKDCPESGIADISLNLYQSLKNNEIHLAFIVGEDPVGCAKNPEVAKLLEGCNYTVVMDYFMTPTAQQADLILPASLPFEIGGSYTNARREINVFESALPSKVNMDSLKQFSRIMYKLGINSVQTAEEARDELIRHLADTTPYPMQPHLICTPDDSGQRHFDYGCDAIRKRIETELETSMNSAQTK